MMVTLTMIFVNATNEVFLWLEDMLRWASTVCREELGDGWVKSIREIPGAVFVISGQYMAAPDVAAKKVNHE